MLGTAVCTVLSYLTLTAGDNGIKCPSASPQTVQKVAVRGATVCHDGYLVSVASPPHAPGCAASRHVRLEWSQSDTLVDELERGSRSSGLPRQAPCRGRCLVASWSLSLTGPCRDAWRVAASSLRCPGWPSRQAPLAGVLFLEWPSRQAPLAGDLSPWHKYFVLEWLQWNHGGPWRSPGKPCRGVLRLPVHKFGILGYPYSSTPTC